MKPAPFRYERPNTAAEAVSLLAANAPGARLLAGGQTLMPLMVRRTERPAMVIDINRIAGLDQIEVLPSHVRMGAMVRQEQALRSAAVCKEVPGVAAALAWVANPVVRRRGTVVGNLVTNSPGAELPAVALALGAQFVVRHVDHEETVPVAALLGPQKRTPSTVMVTHVLWPRRPARVGFYEVARRDGHIPVVSSLVTLNEEDCRVALSGVCITGLSCPTLAQVIARRFPRIPDTDDLAGALREDLTGDVYADSYADIRYRLNVAPVVSARATGLMLQDRTT